MDNEKVDELFGVRCSLYSGNYQQCIQEASKVKVSSEQTEEKNILVYRAYIAQHKYGVIFDEINEQTASPDLKAVRLFAEYLSKRNSGNSEIGHTIINKFESMKDEAKNMWYIMYASVLFLEQDYDGVQRVLHGCDHIESYAYRVMVLLAIDRPDLAKKYLKTMNDIDQDSCLTNLCGAWLNLAVGGDKLVEAYYSFQEMADKYSSSPLLLNGMAAAYVHQSKHEEAEGVLSEALDKDSNNVETHVNSLVFAKLAGKGYNARHCAQAKSIDSNHKFVAYMKNKENEFDRIAAQYSENFNG